MSMLSRRGAGPDQLLLPASPVFIWVSLFFALLLNLVPLGRTPAMPDLVALALVFWNVHQPRKVGMGVAFFFGVLMDVHDSALLGQHALAYTLLSFFAITIHRRILWFSVGAQALHVLPLFAAGHLVSMLLRWAVDGVTPGWSMVLAPVYEVALWAPASWLLLAPQRRAPDPDENRPL